MCWEREKTRASKMLSKISIVLKNSKLKVDLMCLVKMEMHNASGGSQKVLVLKKVKKNNGVDAETTSSSSSDNGLPSVRSEAIDNIRGREGTACKICLNQ
jgi:hypothetical protein